MKKLFLSLVSLFSFILINAQKQTSFSPGKVWLDNNGVPINAHGGNVIFHKNKYYWYGEHKLEGKSEAQFADGGIHCYSSKDLMNWKDEGIVLSVSYTDSTNDLAYGCILERPKVIYNKSQKKFIAYFKFYPKGTGYLKGYIGVATSKKPNGPFTYQHKFLGASSPNGSGDFSMFKDKDQSIYHLTVRKPDKTFVIGKLNSDNLFPANEYEPVKGIESHTEAPAVIFHEGKYYLLGSGSSGWKPNKARSFSTDSLSGNFRDLGNPCFGKNPNNGIGADVTFGGQLSYILPVEGKEGTYIAMFDIWKPEKAIEGLYIWLPLFFENGKPVIKWVDNWDVEVFGKQKAEQKSWVDPQSPKDAAPVILPNANDEKSTTSNWKLDFSDEFNDNKIDVRKWTVENTTKKRVDVTLFADDNQVEEKDGNIFIYYRKSNINDTAYNAGRFNSKGKYAPTYGFLECRMHIVKPNGHQMAFWMMPEGDGMKAPIGVDGTANDGAEIDIIEGTKADAYSLGLHWDGYAKPAHKSNGSLIKTPGIHNQEYHVYGFEWTPTYLKFYYDGKVVKEMKDPKLIPQVAHFIYFSGSCFGENNWLDGDIRKNEFIQKGGTDKSYIDYIRVFKK